MRNYCLTAHIFLMKCETRLAIKEVTVKERLVLREKKREASDIFGAGNGSEIFWAVLYA